MFEEPAHATQSLRRLMYERAGRLTAWVVVWGAQLMRDGGGGRREKGMGSY